MVVKIQGNKQALHPVIYGLEPFDVTEGGTSSHFQVINGQIGKGVDYIYYITPKKKGKFIIGPAEVLINGKKYESQTVHLEVREPPSESGEKKGSLFLTAVLSDDRGYIGQEFIYTLKFYRTKDVSDINLILPEIQGLTFKKLGEHKAYTSLLQGVRYSVIELRYAIIADKPGAYTVPPAYLKMKVLSERAHSRGGRLFDFFDDPFFNIARARPLSIGSNPIGLEVNPLPQEGRPADFSGLVGKFSLRTSLMPTRLKKGESSTLTAVVSGKGNARLMPDLHIPEMKNVKFYTDQPTLNIETAFEGVSGKKTMKWAFVPQKDGNYEIPSLTLSYFDPDLGQYVQSRTKPLTLEVLPGSIEEDTQKAEQKIHVEKPGKKEVNMQRFDILSIHEGLDGLKANRFQRLGIWPLGASVLLPPLVFLLVLGVKLYMGKNKLKEDTIIAKKAAAKFSKRMKVLTGDAPLLEIVKITNLYLNERLGLKSGSLTSEEVYEILIKNGVDKHLATDVKEILLSIEAAIYTGDEGKDHIGKRREGLIATIKKIDRALP
jgi:hypothetical protein